MSRAAVEWQPDLGVWNQGPCGGIEHVGGGVEVRVEQRVITVEAQPAVRARGYRKLEAFGRRAVVIDEVGLPAVGEFDWAAGRGRVGDERDLVAEAVLEINALDAEAVLPQELLEADVDAARTLWPQLGVAQKGKALTEGFDHSRRLDALAVIDAQPRGASLALQPGPPEQYERPDLRHDFGPEADLAEIKSRAEVGERLRKPFRDLGLVVFDAGPYFDTHARRVCDFVRHECARVRPQRRGSVETREPAVEHRALLLVFKPRRDEMAPERRDVRQVGLIAQPAAAVVIVEIVAAIAAEVARAELQDGLRDWRRVGPGQILGDRIEAQEIAFGICEREALAPALGRLIVQSGASRDAAAFSALIGVGKKSPGGARRAQSGIFVPRGQSHLRPRVEDVTQVGRSDPVLVIVVAVAPVGAQMGEAGGVIKSAVRAGQARELAVEREAPAFAC